MTRIPERALEGETDQALIDEYSLPVVREALVQTLGRDKCTAFDTLFERAARLGALPEPNTAIEWMVKYAASGRGIPDAIPRWDVACRQWLMLVCEQQPTVVADRRESLPAGLGLLAHFCLVAVTGRELEPALGDLVAKHFLNAGPNGFAYEKWIDKARVRVAVEQLLQREAFPILRRERIEQLAQNASRELALGLAVNYCAQDFRSVGVGVLAKAPALDAEVLDEWARRTPSPEGSIVLGLCYVRVAREVVVLPAWVEASLLLDLSAGSSDDIDVTRASMLALPGAIARSLLSRVLREERALLLVPALADETLLNQFLAAVDSGEVERSLAIAALSHCGAAGVEVLLSLQNRDKVSANLATVVASALGQVLPNYATSEQRKNAAQLLTRWLAHPSKTVVQAAKRTLEGLGDDALIALRTSLVGAKRALAVEIERLLSRHELQAKVVETPLDALERRASELDTARSAFLELCEKVYVKSEAWGAELRPSIRKYGAVCLHWLRAWFVEHVPAGDVRLWCYVVEQLAFDPEAAWVAVDTFSRMPKLPTSVWARPRRALARLHPHLIAPVTFVLTHGTTEYREALYSLVAERSDSSTAGLLLAALSDDSKVLRTCAIDGLSRLNDVPLDEVTALLQAQNPGVRVAAAELLAVWGRPQAKEALLRAQALEKRQGVSIYLDEALAAVGETPWQSSESDPEAGLARYLTARGQGMEAPRFLLTSPLPALVFRAGARLGPEAALGFLALVTQLDATLKGRLVREVSRLLEPRALASWSRHLHERWLRSKDTRFKWAVYQLWLLADEQLIDEVGESVGGLRSSDHVVVGCYLRVLQWRASKVALDWLVHWSHALPSRGSRTLARTLLGRVAFRQQVTVAALRRAADGARAVRAYEARAALAKPKPFERERFLRYLEACWLSDRAWSLPEWLRLGEQFADVFSALAWQVELGNSAPELAVWLERPGQFKTRLGRVAHDSVQRIRLAHPLDAHRKTWPWAMKWLSQHREAGVQQPFPQDQRRVFVYESESDLDLSALTTDSERLERWLKRRAWFHGEPLDHGIVYNNFKRVDSLGVTFQLNHSGYAIGHPDASERVEVTSLEAFDDEGTVVDLGSVPPLVYSEICYSVSDIATKLE